MLHDPAVQARFEPGTSVIVGTASSDGEPYATRAFSVAPTSEDWHRVRVAVAADDAGPTSCLSPGAQVAITGADVCTLLSAQLKGTVALVEPPTEADLERAHHHMHRLAELIEETDGTDRGLVLRMFPARLLAIEVEVHEQYDQSPGPEAGAALGRRR